MTRRTFNPFFKVESRKSKILWTIPSEIVDTIFRFLPELDKACFALSCKRLHACYVSYNRQRGISVLSTLPRTELLLRLQNKRWVYCTECQNLHRYSRRRHLLELGKTRERKPSTSECKAWYKQHASKTDIYPCPGTTFYQKKHSTDCRYQKETGYSAYKMFLYSYPTVLLCTP